NCGSRYNPPAIFGKLVFTLQASSETTKCGTDLKSVPHWNRLQVSSTFSEKKLMKLKRIFAPQLLVPTFSLLILSPVPTFLAKQQPAINVKDRYTKSEHRIPMRDGKRLFTVVYAPRDSSHKYPLLMHRTPYSAGPYGDAYRPSLGPSPAFMREGYIFVYQDVRGTFLSEGEFEDVRPFIPDKKTNHGEKEIDEASDTYDTIEWLLRNIPNNDGRVGMWGISYPGF